MKKIKISIFASGAFMLAIAFAFITLAFTAPQNTADMYVFEYQGDFSPGSVSNTANWHFEGKNLPLCNDINIRACRVAVTVDHVDNPNNPSALDSGITITEGGSGSNIYVASISGTGSTFSNRSN